MINKHLPLPTLFDKVMKRIIFYDAMISLLSYEASIRRDIKKIRLQV